MKKIFLTIVVMLMAFCSFAQWVNNGDGTKSCVLDETGDVRLVMQNDNSYALVFSTTNSRFDYAQTFVLGNNKSETLDKLGALREALNTNNVEILGGKDAAGVEHQFKAENLEGAAVLLGHNAGAKGVWTLGLASIEKAVELLK